MAEQEKEIAELKKPINEVIRKLSPLVEPAVGLLARRMMPTAPAPATIGRLESEPSETVPVEPYETMPPAEPEMTSEDEDELLAGAEDVEKTYTQQVLPDKMRYNLEAIEKFSFFGDIKLMFMTVFAVKTQPQQQPLAHFIVICSHFSPVEGLIFSAIAANSSQSARPPGAR